MAVHVVGDLDRRVPGFGLDDLRVGAAGNPSDTAEWRKSCGRRGAEPGLLGSGMKVATRNWYGEAHFAQRR